MTIWTTQTCLSDLLQLAASGRLAMAGVTKLDHASPLLCLGMDLRCLNSLGPESVHDRTQLHDTMGLEERSPNKFAPRGENSAFHRLTSS